MTEQRDCERCGHDFDVHELMTDKVPPTAGIILCPEDDCNCVGTWSVPEAVAQKMRNMTIDEEP